MGLDDMRCARCGLLPYRHEQPYPSGPLGAAYDEVREGGNSWRKRRIMVCKGYTPKGQPKPKKKRKGK